MHRLFLCSILAIFFIGVAFVGSVSNLEISIHDNYKQVAAGNDIWFTIKIANLGEARRADISLNYWISDDKNSIIAENKETMAVQTQASFVRTFNIPKDTGPGIYKINVKMDYGGSEEASANNSFEITEKKPDNRLYYAVIGIVGLVILIYIAFKSKPLIARLRIRAEVSRIVRNRKLN